MINPTDTERKRPLLELRVPTIPQEEFRQATAPGFTDTNMCWLNLKTGGYRFQEDERGRANGGKWKFDVRTGAQADYGEYSVSNLPCQYGGRPEFFNSRRMQFRKRQATSIPEILAQWAQGMYLNDAPPSSQTSWGIRDHGGESQEEEEEYLRNVYNRGDRSHVRVTSGRSNFMSRDALAQNNGISRADCHTTHGSSSMDSVDVLGAASLDWWAIPMAEDFYKELAGYNTKAVQRTARHNTRLHGMVYDVKHTRMHKIGGWPEGGPALDPVLNVERAFKLKLGESLPKSFEDGHVDPNLVWHVASKFIGDEYQDNSSYDNLKSKCCAFLHFTDESTGSDEFISRYGNDRAPKILNISREEYDHGMPNNTYFAIIRKGATCSSRFRRIGTGRYLRLGQHYQITGTSYCRWDSNEGLLRTPYDCKLLPVSPDEVDGAILNHSDPVDFTDKEFIENLASKLMYRKAVHVRNIIACNCVGRAAGMSVPPRGPLSTPAFMFIGNSLFRYGNLIARVVVHRGKNLVLFKDFSKSGERTPRTWQMPSHYFYLEQFFHSLRINGKGFLCVAVTADILSQSNDTVRFAQQVRKHLRFWRDRAESVFKTHMRARLNSHKHKYLNIVKHMETITQVFERDDFDKYVVGLRDKVRVATMIMKEKALETVRRNNGLSH
jgi:hypothetical protein